MILSLFIGLFIVPLIIWAARGYKYILLMSSCRSDRKNILPHEQVFVLENDLISDWDERFKERQKELKSDK